MAHVRRPGSTLAVAVLTVAALLGGTAYTQEAAKPTTDAPNPYQTVADSFKLPAGRTWGSTSAVEIDRDGRSVWVAERCGLNRCLDAATGKWSELDTILKFDESGKLVKSFGAGLLIFPHGIFVDREGNVWVTDGQDNGTRPARGGAAGAAAGTPPGAMPPAATPPAGAPAATVQGGGRGAGAMGPPADATKGGQVFKFSPDGKLLMTLGKPGGAAEPDYFYQPNDVLVAPNGDIFVAEGHGGANSRILKFSKDGKLIKVIGKKGTGPGEFDQPHGLAMDSKGRLIVGDRGNNRVQILDQNGTFIAQTAEFSRPSGVYVDRNDTLYVADSESGSVNRTRPEWKRGIRIGKLSDLKVTAFIPDPDSRTFEADKFTGTSTAEGVAVDSRGNVYGAEVGPKAVKKYVRKTSSSQ